MNFLPTLKSLVLTYQSFEQYSAPHIKSMGLTMTQFDVIATLGNQPPMTCKDLGNKTLVTKGTLTGVEDKGIIQRSVNQADARSQMIGLTKKGQQLFERVFPEHLQHLQKAFGQLSKQDLHDLTQSLQKLKAVFINH
jgi:MarR family 2-MHQ and catechol resistance regulon transcriptional repressor